MDLPSVYYSYVKRGRFKAQKEKRYHGLVNCHNLVNSCIFDQNLKKR